MKHTGIPISGFRVKDGKIIKAEPRLSVSAKIARKKSKKVKVKRQ